MDENDGGSIDAVLEALADGDITLEEARDRVRGVRWIGEYARIDPRQGARTGIPEIVYGARKADDVMIGIGGEMLAGAGHAILTDVTESVRDELTQRADSATFHEGSQTLVISSEAYEPPEERGTVGVVTAGSSDIPIAEEAVILAEEMGCRVETVYDVGVSAIHRLFNERLRLDGCDVVVVGAGREGALATVVAGMVSCPVIGLPIGTGRGAGGDGEAALLGMLQSCTFLTVVNIDAGFVAGGQAALIARG